MIAQCYILLPLSPVVMDVFVILESLTRMKESFSAGVYKQWKSIYEG